MRLALLQHACAEDPEVNLRHAEALIREAADQGAELVITPELFLSRYFCFEEDEAHFRLAEPIPGPRTRRLGEVARACRVHLHASLFERRAPGLFHNTSVLFNPEGEIVERYRKMHIPDDPSYYEKFYFTPGDRGWRVAPAGDVRLGMLVCWDQWFPEAARLTAMRGADLLVYPTAIGYLAGEPEPEQRRQQEAWITVQRGHAIANGVFVAAVNRVGREGELTFWGGSFVVDPGGEILAQAGQTREQILTVDCDPARLDAIRPSWPFFRDRRIDAYRELTERYLDPPPPSPKPGVDLGDEHR